MDYEAIKTDQAQTLRTLCNYVLTDAGKRPDDDRITAAIKSVLSDPVLANFNIGRSGRGRSELKRAQLNHITRVKRSFTMKVADLQTRGSSLVGD
jgi:hypothetical protein